MPSKILHFIAIYNGFVYIYLYVKKITLQSYVIHVYAHIDNLNPVMTSPLSKLKCMFCLYGVICKEMRVEL